MDDAAIHRVLEDADGYAVRLLISSGSPRLKRLAMTRVVQVGMRVDS